MPKTGAQLLDLEVLQRAEGVRFDLLDSNLTVIGELHPTVTAAVDVDTTAAYMRALRNLGLLESESADIDTFNSRIKPWWVLETGDEYPLGVYMFQARDRQLRSWGGPTVCPLLIDQTWILDSGRRSTYSVPAGSLLTDHLHTLAAEAGVLDETGIENSSIVASNDLGWQTGTSRLQIMSELCDRLTFHPPYFDNTGRLICRSIPMLSLATPDHTYALGDVSRVVVDSATESDDAWAAPNVFIVVNTSATGTAISGSYEAPSDAPESELHRGFQVVAPPIDAPGVETSAQAAAMAQAAYEQSSKYKWIELDATPDPRHDVFAIVEYDGVNYRETGWSLPLTPGGPQHHSLKRIYT